MSSSIGFPPYTMNIRRLQTLQQYSGVPNELVKLLPASIFLTKSLHHMQKVTIQNNLLDASIIAKSYCPLCRYYICHIGVLNIRNRRGKGCNDPTPTLSSQTTQSDPLCAFIN
jgi:hypothetical protein